MADLPYKTLRQQTYRNRNNLKTKPCEAKWRGPEGILVFDVYSAPRGQDQPLVVEFRLRPLSGRVAETPGGPGLVESRCGAVAVGRTYLLPPLSSDGALVVRP